MPRWLITWWGILLSMVTLVGVIPTAQAGNPTVPRTGYEWNAERHLHGTEGNRGTHYNPWICKTNRGCQYPLGTYIRYNGIFQTQCPWVKGQGLQNPNCGGRHNNFALAVGAGNFQGTFRFGGNSHPLHRTEYPQVCADGSIRGRDDLHPRSSRDPDHGHCGRWERLTVATTTTTTPNPVTTTTTTTPNPVTTTTTTTPRPTTTTTIPLPPIRQGWNGRCYMKWQLGESLGPGPQLPSYGGNSHYVRFGKGTYEKLPPGVTKKLIRIDPEDRKWRVIILIGTPRQAGVYRFTLHASVRGAPHLDCTIEVITPQWDGGCSADMKVGKRSWVYLPKFGMRKANYYVGGELPPGMGLAGWRTKRVTGIPEQVGEYQFRWFSAAPGRAGDQRHDPYVVCRISVLPATTTTTTTTTTTPPTTTTTTTTTMPPTTTTTTPPPVTTTTVPPGCSWMVPAPEVQEIRRALTWKTFVPQSEERAVVPRGAAVPGGNHYLVVAGERGSGIYPGVWPTWDRGLEVTDTGGCRWTARSVVTRVRELFMWNQPDQAMIRQTAPVVADRWDRLTADQQTQTQQQQLADWQRIGGGDDRPNPVWLGSDCPVDEVARSSNCQWGLPHPGVYRWEMSVAYTTVDPNSGRTLHSELLVAAGATQFLRLIDYADFQGRR